MECSKLDINKLFIRDEIGNIKEIEPMSVLDFYVHESYQRTGYGKFLFETMLDKERLEPNKIAYDRPSKKLLKFLKKHYGLANYVSQANNFVVFSSYFTHDKTYKTFVKDPVKPRGKAEKPGVTAANTGLNYPGPSQEMYQPVDNGTNAIKLPPYQEAVKLRTQAEGGNFESAYPPQPTNTEFEEGKNYYEAQAADNKPEDLAGKTTGGSKKVQFSDEPKYYDIPDRHGYDPSTEQLQQDNNNYLANEGYTHNNYEEYNLPAGRNYMNPNIEKDQFERKFNRTSTKFDTEETVQDIFSHPEPQGPLDNTGDLNKQKTPIEFDIKKTNQRIDDTETELKKCQDRINQLQSQSEELSKTSQGFNPSEKFLNKERKQIYSGEKDVIKAEENKGGYNKRFGFATVYDNKFKNIAKDPSIIDNERSTTLSNAGSKLLAQNPNMNVYQHQELLRSNPFGVNIGGDNAFARMTSSSAYGNFFAKRKI